MSLEFLTSVLESDAPTGEDLERFLLTRSPEGLHLDYKHGRLLEKPKKERARDLRSWVAGFANGDGGVLLVGVADPADPNAFGITTLPEMGSNPAEWATRSLTSLAPYLVPAPRIHTIDHRDGKVLLLAVGRAPNLVPCIEEGQPVYYLRIGDQTVRIDPYLHADLVLGRRRHPLLTLTGAASIKTDGSDVVLDWTFELGNEGLVWAEDPHFGMFGYWSRSESAARAGIRELPRHLLSQAAAPRLGQLNASAVTMALRTFTLEGRTTSLPALSTATAKTRFLLPSQIDEVVWSAAVFVVCRNSLPLWAEAHVSFRRLDGTPWGGVFNEQVEQMPPGKRPRLWWGSVESFVSRTEDGAFDG